MVSDGLCTTWPSRSHSQLAPYGECIYAALYAASRAPWSSMVHGGGSGSAVGVLVECSECAVARVVWLHSIKTFSQSASLSAPQCMALPASPPIAPLAPPSSTSSLPPPPHDPLQLFGEFGWFVVEIWTLNGAQVSGRAGFLLFSVFCLFAGGPGE